MWTVYYPFSTEEVVSIYQLAGVRICPLLAKRELKCSIYNEARGDCLAGYHNFADILDFHCRLQPGFSLNLSQDDREILIDCFLYVVDPDCEHRENDIRIKVEEKDLIKLGSIFFEILHYEGMGGVEIFGENGFSWIQFCELIYLHFCFYISAFELDVTYSDFGYLGSGCIDFQRAA